MVETSIRKSIYYYYFYNWWYVDDVHVETSIRKSIYYYREKINRLSVIVMRRGVPEWEKAIHRSAICGYKREIKYWQLQLEWLKEETDAKNEMDAV